MVHTPAHPTDAELVEASRTGDEQAFTTLMRCHQHGVLNLCRRIAPLEAQDVAQEAFTQAFVGLDRLRDPARFGPWVHAIAANVAARARRRPTHVPLDAVPPGALVAPVARDVELGALVRAALADLPSPQRSSVLGFLAGFSYDELAARSGTARSTIRGRIHTARRQLRASLRPEEEPKMTASTVTVVPAVYGTFRRSTDRVVVLHEQGGKRHLGVRCDAADAGALERALGAGDLPEAPLADLALQLVEQLGARIERVSLGAVGGDGGESYYGVLRVSAAGRRVELRARTADALVLAVRSGTPIVVPRALWDEHSRGDTPAELRADDEAARARLRALAPRTGVEVPPGPALAAELQLAVERVLERLAGEPAVRTAILVHACGAVQAWRGAGDPDLLVLYGVLWADREGARLEPPPGIDEDELAQLVATGVHPSTEVLGGVRFERVGDWRLDVSLRPREPSEGFETAFAAAVGELTELLAV